MAFQSARLGPGLSRFPTKWGSIPRQPTGRRQCLIYHTPKQSTDIHGGVQLNPQFMARPAAEGVGHARSPSAAKLADLQVRQCCPSQGVLYNNDQKNALRTPMSVVCHDCQKREPKVDLDNPAGAWRRLRLS